jgi:hypothetical protein
LNLYLFFQFSLFSLDDTSDLFKYLDFALLKIEYSLILGQFWYELAVVYVEPISERRTHGFTVVLIRLSIL